LKIILSTIFAFIFLTSNSQLNTQNIINKARTDIYNKNYSEALQKLNSVIEIKPELIEPYFYRGIIKYQLNDFVGADADLTKTITMNPYYTSAYHYLGIVKSNMFDFSSAISHINKAIGLSSYDASIYLTKGIIYLQMNETEKAISSFNESVKLNNQIAETYLNIGIAHLIRKEYNESLKNLNKAIKLNSFFADAFARKAIVYLETNKLDSSLTEINAAIKLDKNNPLYYYWRANINYKIPNFNATISDYSKTIELSPENALAYYNRAIVENEIGLYNEAITDYAKVNELEPNNLLAYYNKGTIFYNQNNYKQTIIEMTKSIEILPEFYQAYKLRSISKLKIGDKKGAFTDNLIAEKLNNNINKIGIDTNKLNKIISLNDNFTSITNNKNTIEAFKNIEFKIVTKEFNTDVFLKNYFYEEIEELNSILPKQYKVVLTNNNSDLNNNQTNEIELFLANLPNKNSKEMLFLTSLINIEIKNNKTAEDKLITLITTTNNYFIANYTLATLYEKTFYLNNSLTSVDNTININGLNNNYTTSKNKTNYTQIIDYYSKLLQKNALVNFNLGNIYNTLGEYYTSIYYYTKSINEDPYFTFAYFNRGLTNILIKENEKACIDFSKSGELGFQKAYNLIKQYCNPIK